MHILLNKKLILGLGICSLFGFVLFYYPIIFFFFFPERYSVPFHSLQGLLIPLIVILAVIFLNLLLLNTGNKSDWKTKGIYAAFIISLFTEMFGYAFLVYLFSPLFTYPVLTISPFPKAYMISGILGVYVVLSGIVLIIVGWKGLYAQKGLVTEGVYTYIRHPQYLGFILIALGWVMYWPTVILYALFPFYVLIYLMQARKESITLEREYGEAYVTYKKHTKAFIPGIL